MTHNPSETLKFDLQLFAENDPNLDPQPLEPGQQVIEDGEESSSIFEPEAATEPGTQKPDPDSSKAEGSSLPEPQYEIDGVQFTPADVKRWKERDGEVGNEEKWKSNLNRRGQELNVQEATLKQREEGLEKNQNLLTEYGQFKSVVNANPQAREYFEKLVKDPQSAMQPQLQKIQDSIDERFSALDVKDAQIRMTRDFKDYDPTVCEDAMKDFDGDNPYHVNLIKYYTWKGMNLETEIQKRIASGNVERGPALPPLASGVTHKRTQKFNSPEEAANAVLRDLGLST